MVRGSFWSIKLSSEKNKVVSPLGGLYNTPTIIGFSALLIEMNSDSKFEEH